MIAGERVRLGLIERQDAHQSSNALQGHGKGRVQLRGHLLVIRKTFFDHGVAVDYGDRVLRNPAAQAGADRDLQRRQKPKVISTDEFGRQHIAFPNEGDKGIVRHEFAQTHGN